MWQPNDDMLAFLGKIVILQSSDIDFYYANDTNELDFVDDDVALSVKQTRRNSKQSLSLVNKITLQNEEQKILNLELFGPIRRETYFITIQVHNRIEYLRHLIDSLRSARDIEKALLIFSHDVYDDAINELIMSIHFCMVLQIFYPYSIQLYENVFPGTDTNDCPRDIGKDEAIKIDCNNAKYPDTYGHFREAKYSQMKHHWWWKLNQIFDLKVTRDLDINLLLLEEDYYVAEDFLYVYRLIQRQMPRECPQCNVIALGTYSEKLDESTYNKLEISSWTTNLHNMGMALNTTTWKSIRECAQHFCNYDEYNYDFSLQNINRKCLKKKLVTALIRGPRVFHLGDCGGIHHMNEHCDVNGKINELNANLREAKKHRLLFPEDLEISSVNLLQPTDALVNNGGWSDNRDQCLCLKMTHEKSKQSSNCHNVLALR